MVMLFWIRRKIIQRASEKVLCEIITKDNNSYNILAPVNHALVESSGDGRNVISKKKDEIKEVQGRKPKMWPINENCTFRATYPENWPKMLQTSIQKVVLREDNLEPVSNITGIATVTPELIFNYKNEVFTELAVVYSRQIKEMQEALERQVNPKVVMYWLAGLTLAVVGVGYYVFTNLPAMMDTLNRIAAGMGV
jgi:hypothetical protein